MLTEKQIEEIKNRGSVLEVEKEMKINLSGIRDKCATIHSAVDQRGWKAHYCLLDQIEESLGIVRQLRAEWEKMKGMDFAQQVMGTNEA
jgi:hypothetical protein